ncbi:DoxX family protein [Aquimarina sp. 2201CG5-10]|uniref:DoxX family protein n=1 Tax=Aquimarina callyspongiae TaxID=3098150 RepID=UPI002AB4E69E|nr:DoxX family protein [Aquimarina sp. 2201CG5-10]MDY8135168.1 DoxX family protein [Aquimarina sp. 2201CG5-10]
MKIVYWIATAALCAIMLYSAQMYFRNTEMVEGFFESFNYPKYIVIPLAVAKVLAVIAILTNKIKWIKEWAYAGIFFDLVLASMAHQYAGHPIGMSVYAILILAISYATGKKVRP